MSDKITNDVAAQIMKRPVAEQKLPFEVDAETWHHINHELHHTLYKVLAAPGPVPNFLLCGVPVTIKSGPDNTPAKGVYNVA